MALLAHSWNGRDMGSKIEFVALVLSLNYWILVGCGEPTPTSPLPGTELTVTKPGDQVHRDQSLALLLVTGPSDA